MGIEWECQLNFDTTASMLAGKWTESQCIYLNAQYTSLYLLEYFPWGWVIVMILTVLANLHDDESNRVQHSQRYRSWNEFLQIKGLISTRFDNWATQACLSSGNGERQLSSDTTASMLAAAPGVYKLFMEGGDIVPYVWQYKLGSRISNKFYFVWPYGRYVYNKIRSIIKYACYDLFITYSFLF